MHGAFFALHRGKAARAFHHKAHSTGGVAVVGRHFAWQDQLHADINGGCGYQFLNAVAGVAKYQDAALGFFNGRQFTCTHQLGAHIFVMPNERLCGA